MRRRGRGGLIKQRLEADTAYSAIVATMWSVAATQQNWSTASASASASVSTSTSASATISASWSVVPSSA